MEEICLKSQGLEDVPDSVMNSNCKNLNLDFNDIFTLPSTFCENLTSLTILSINGNNLVTLPGNICLLSELHELYLKENYITKLPETLGELKHLQELNLIGNQLKQLPENIHSLCQLVMLNVSENIIESLPNTFGNLECLSFLNLSYNSIEYLPESFGNLTNLKTLDLSSNSLMSLPDSFQNLPSLEILNLNSNKIKTLPDTFLSSRTLQKLVMCQNQLSHIPPWFSEMENIKEIYLSDNYLSKTPFPEEFGEKCLNLELLDLSGNNITGLPNSFGKLTNLSILDLGSSFDELERNPILSNGNELVYLPNSFCNLKNLSKLQLDENQIEVLPEEFGCLKHLTYLDLSKNKLKVLPESFGHFEQLRVCLLSMNYLTYLPPSFGMLKVVEELKLDSNLLEYLPESFENMVALKSLDLYNNKLTKVPEAVKKLKSLKHLEFRGNDFGSSLEDLFNISFKPSYQKRDPNLEDNWRGRVRSDIKPDAWVRLKKSDIPDRKCLENDSFREALTGAAALWRRHGEKDIRRNPKEFSDLAVNGIDFTAEKDLNSEPDDESEDWNADDFNFESPEILIEANVQDTLETGEVEYWDDDAESYSSKSSTACSSAKDVDPVEESDWETSSEEQFPNNFQRVYRHPSTKESSDDNMQFTPSDFHVQRISRPEVWCAVEEGQFDDAES